MNLDLYCNVDDFWKSFKQEWEKHLVGMGKSKRGPGTRMINSRGDDNRYFISSIRL